MFGTEISLLHFLGYVSLGISLLALVVVVKHWRFFHRAEQSGLGKRMALVFLSDIAVYASIAAYGLNWVLMDGALDFRLWLKVFQVLSVFFNLYALTNLMMFYKKVK